MRVLRPAAIVALSSSITIAALMVATAADAQAVPKVNSMDTCVYVATMQLIQRNPGLKFKPVFFTASQQTYEFIEKHTLTAASVNGRTFKYFLTKSAPCSTFKSKREARKFLISMLKNNWRPLKRSKPALCCWSHMRIYR